VKRPFLALIALAALAFPLRPDGAAASRSDGSGPGFPADGFVPGWSRAGAVETYNPSALYNVIDGGAELFLEMGFVELRVQKYAGAGAEIAVEDYRMDGAAAALGIYLLKCGNETPVPGIAARNSGDAFQVALLKDDHFIFINNFSGREDLLPVMKELARRLDEAIPAGAAVTQLDVLPAAGMVPGSALLLRGPYSLQAVYTLGDGDVLLLEGRRFAASASYRGGDGGDHVLIVAPYEDEATAARAFAHLRRNLDAYLQVLDEGAGSFLFKDFQGRFGLAELRDLRMVVRVRMERKPGRP
jgi:hypothetical protein